MKPIELNFAMICQTLCQTLRHNHLEFSEGLDLAQFAPYAF
jgi:hypothetical protein